MQFHVVYAALELGTGIRLEHRTKNRICSNFKLVTAALMYADSASLVYALFTSFRAISTDFLARFRMHSYYIREHALLARCVASPAGGLCRWVFVAFHSSAAARLDAIWRAVTFPTRPLRCGLAHSRNAFPPGRSSPLLVGPLPAATGGGVIRVSLNDSVRGDAFYANNGAF